MAFSGDNDDELWPYLAEQLDGGRLDRELAFYLSEIRFCRGPVLVAGCGTGTVLLELLAAGRDAYGFDASGFLLELLQDKPAARRYPDLRARVTRQDLVDFEYGFDLAAICIRARSFLSLPSEDDAVRCLRNAFDHLAPAGRVLLNLSDPLLALSGPPPSQGSEFGPAGEFRHPRNGETIALSYRLRNGPMEEARDIEWRFWSREQEHRARTRLRRIERGEIELCLQRAGFDRWWLFGDIGRSPWTPEDPELFFIAERPR
ncbi:MAG TPA: class I SAM-dependent methyltransferase [Anaeromyxobacter sp.]|nr:class I SAM-dependent methyltransferase [Anaeromyxobacter sp.]